MSNLMALQINNLSKMVYLDLLEDESFSKEKLIIKYSNSFSVDVINKTICYFGL
jgi:hypothetical protein